MEIKKHLTIVSILGCFLALAISSCTKENQSTATSLPVVEAYLQTGHQLVVKLYQQKSLTDTAKFGSPITGQILSISDGTNTVQLTETKKGNYTYSDTTFLVTGKIYTLTFSYLAKIVSATTVMPAKPSGFSTQHKTVTYSASTEPNAAVDTLNKFTWNNPDSLNHILVFYNIDDINAPLHMISNYQRTYQADTKRKSYYYVTTSNIYSYANYKVALLRVNSEYIDFLNSNSTGANSQNLLNMPTNVINGLGIFTALQSDTLTFSLNK